MAALRTLVWTDVHTVFQIFLRRYRIPLQLSANDLFDHKATEIIDVRTPAEYEIDHIPDAINIPVLDNQQREEVGTLYSKNSFEARKVGASLVTKNIASHIQNHFYDKPRDYSAIVYCWRGGQRSKSLALILSEIGFNAHTLDGGYKAYRKRVVADLEVLPKKFKYNVISGMTGTGKTFLLTKMAEQGHQVLDLECLAKHKGSFLGLWHNEKQPSQKYFESQLREILANFDPTKPIWVESESRKIGKVNIPKELFEELCKSKRFLIHLPIAERVKCTLRDYPHWIEETEKLKDIIKLLRRFHSQTKLDSWISLVENKQWEDLVESLFRDHYDPTYSLSQTRNKHCSDQDEVHMPDQSDASVQRVLNYLSKAVSLN